MIDLSRVRAVMAECLELMAELDGLELDEREALTNQSKGDLRRERAQRSGELRLLADRLHLAGSLTTAEYWTARGEADPLELP